MPEEWEGHPLRKDYGAGRVPVQFKELRPAMSEPVVRSAERIRDPPVPRPPRAPRSCSDARPLTTNELGREVGAVLRLDGLTLDPHLKYDIDRRDDETMIVDIFAGDPSTHGVLHLMLELDADY